MVTEGISNVENFIGGVYFAFAAKLYRTIKGYQNTGKKLSEMKRINTSVLNAVNLPGIEQMLDESKKSDS